MINLDGLEQNKLDIHHNKIEGILLSCAEFSQKLNILATIEDSFTEMKVDTKKLNEEASED
jgi:hypothetical protein